jgi:hypothetical protein
LGIFIHIKEIDVFQAQLIGKGRQDIDQLGDVMR